MRILISVGILFYIFTRPDMDLPNLIQALGAVSPIFIFLAVAIYGIVLVLASFRWVILLRSFNIGVGIPLAFRFTFIGLFFNNMMPSLTGGDVVKGYYLTRGTSKKLEAVASILLDRVFGIYGMISLALFASLCAISDEKLGHLARIVVALSSVFFSGALLFYYLPSLKRFGWVQFLWKRYSWMKGFRNFYDVISIVKKRGKVACVVFGMSLVVQGLIVFENYVLARGLGMEGVSLAKFFVVVPIAGFISALPISFAGWGIGEGAYRTFFMVLNPSYGPIAVALSIAFRLIGLAFSLIGLPFYLTYKHKSSAEV